MKGTIGVVGLWHLGCVLCAAWSKLGHRVIGFDYDTLRVKKLQDGVPPLFEPGLEDALRAGLAGGTVTFTETLGALADCDVVFLSYDTPVRDDDSGDTNILTRSAEDIGQIAKDGAILIVSSQSPVGFCRELRAHLQALYPRLDLAYSPENLRLGDALACYLNPGRIILGTAEPATEARCRELFLPVHADVLAMSLESAEMVKHGINAFLAMSIVFTNQLADVCEAVGARIDDVARGLKSDPRIGHRAYLAPGIGFSGGTLGRDLQALAAQNRRSGGTAEMFSQIHAHNANRKFAIVRRIEGLLGKLDATVTIGVLGVTYKPGTSTLRRSLPLEIVALLEARTAKVRVFDPKADYGEVASTAAFAVVPDIPTLARDADLLLLLTEWPEFCQFDWRPIPALMRKPNLLDAKNALDEGTLKAAGFRYFSIGR
jgi:UDPglucose 6-dehydrogenase